MSDARHSCPPSLRLPLYDHDHSAAFWTSYGPDVLWVTGWAVTGGLLGGDFHSAFAGAAIAGLVVARLNWYRFLVPFPPPRHPSFDLVLNELGIHALTTSIPWGEVANVQLETSKIHGAWAMRFGERATPSSGMNRIEVTSVSGEEISGYYFLGREADAGMVRRQLWDCVVRAGLGYASAKRILQPADYAEHQELKRRLEASA